MWERFLATMQQRTRTLNTVLERHGLSAITIEGEGEGSDYTSASSSTAAPSHYMPSTASEGKASLDARQSSGSTPPTPLLPISPSTAGSAQIATVSSSAVSLERADVQGAPESVFVTPLISMPEHTETNNAEQRSVSTTAEALLDLPAVTLLDASAADLDGQPLDYAQLDGSTTPHNNDHPL